MICIPIKKKTSASVVDNLEEAQKVGDIIEIWFDEINDLTDKKLKEIIKKNKLPLIYKSSGEKIELVLKGGIDFIDLDLETPSASIKLVKKISPTTQIILSHHDFKKTPSIEELKKIATRMRKKGADIAKIAATAQSLQDSLEMLQFVKEESEKSKVIGLCMGEEGKITRTTGHLFGNYLMYAPLKRSDNTAPGQIEAEKLKEIRNTI